MLVEGSKMWGLFYLVGFSVFVLIYTFLPANRKRFERAEREIFEEDDSPWT
jgi:cytochrome c oxidase cbb3-type subunit 4